MARHRKTLALIIISLTILATVITAFRVRDPPKNLEESYRSELNKHNCENCDVNDVKNKYSVKTESAAKRYEELKKAVRDKQQELHPKGSTKPILKFVIDDNDDDDDDDDEDLEVLKRVSGLKKDDHPKVTKTKIVGKSSKVLETKPKYNDIDSDDTEDDDDDDDEDDNKIPSLLKKQTLKVDKKKNNFINSKSVKSNTKHEKYESDNDDDDDNDDDHEDDEDDDDDYDDDDDEIDFKSKQKSSIKEKLKTQKKVTEIPLEIDSKLKVKEVKLPTTDSEKKPASKSSLKKEETSSNKNKDKDDGEKSKNKKPLVNSESKTRIKDEQKTNKEVKKTVNMKDDDDDDEDDDDENGFLSSLRKLAKDFTSTYHEDKPTKVQSKEKIKQKSDLKPDDEKKPGIDKKDQKNTKEADNKPKDKAKSGQEKKNEETSKKVQKLESDKLKELKETKPMETKGSKLKETKEVKHKVDSKENINKSKPTESKKKPKSSIEILLESHEIFPPKPQDDQMKFVTDALYRRNLLVSEFDDFYAFFPTFAPNFSRIHNPECRRQGQILLRQLRGTKLWALNMLDATAKIPSGILQGNAIQLGDFDQCLDSRAKVQLDTGSVVKVQGKYCLATLDVKAEHEELEIPVHLAQAKNLIKSKIDDPGHFVPRFSTLSWGVCVPAACEPHDVEVVIRDSVKHYQHRSGLVIKVKVDEDDCHTQDSDWWEDWFELPTILTLSFYGIIVLLVFIATLQDFFARRQNVESNSEGDEQSADQKDAGEVEEKKEEKSSAKSADGFLSSFSLYRTIEKLLAPSSDDEIACIHGVRGVATAALLIAHKFLPVAVMPYTNRLKITEIASSWVWSWARAGWMFTDCFLLLSGALTAHRQSDSDSSAPWRFFTRYLRLTPALLAVVLFYAYVWDLIGEGPMWGTLVTKNVQVCEESWWWNLFYIQNWFGFEEMCAPQTHQLALDMQLTILSGVVLWVVQSEHVASRLLMPALHAAAIYFRYTTVRDHRLTMIAYHGVTVSQLYRTARLSYTSVLHRSTPYLIGLSLGLALRKPAQHGKLVSIVGWLTAIGLWGSVLWAGRDTGATTYRYSASFAAQYAAFAPVASALAIAWVIYAVHNSDSGFLLKFLCWRPLVLISRLSYALYLCQFIVFLTKAATVRTATEFTFMSLIDVQEISAIILASTVLTLTMVIPMQSLYKVFVFSPKETSGEEIKEEGEEKKEVEPTVDEPEDIESEKLEHNHVEDVTEVPLIRSRQSLLAHREILEEIPEAEVEYEAQRDKLEGLEEILEEEEDEDVANHIDEEDLEVIEEEGDAEEVEGDAEEVERDAEEDGGDFWAEREEVTPRRYYVRDEDADEWEWTNNGDRGAQYYRYSR